MRTLWRWLTDWRTFAILTASILVGLLGAVVIDSIDARRDADARTDRTIAELQRRTDRIGELNAQIDRMAAAQSRMAEQVRAMREMGIDGGVIEPRPAATPRPRATVGTGRPPSSAPRPAPRPSSKPSAKPPPSPSPTPSPPYCQVPTPLICPADRPAVRR